MTQVMKNVRVLEVAQFTFTPAAGAVLADWGADVIKIEHPVRGDAQRGMQMLQGMRVSETRNLLMHHPNRGKRSVGVDLSTEEGRQLLYEIAATADVFLTNYLPAARRKLKIDVDDIRKHNPNIIYARGSALGDMGPERESGGFDSTAFWARAGSAMLVSPKELGLPLQQPGPAYGDSIGGMNIAGGIAAALFHRERTGEAVEVDVSLLSTGLWAAACSIDVCLDLGHVPFGGKMPKSGAGGPGNPFTGVFETSDGRAINLSVITPGPYIRDTFEHLGLGHMADDPRFATDRALMENCELARPEIIRAFAEKPFAEWLEQLKTMRGQWAPYQTPLEAGRDSQAIANGFVFEVEDAGGGDPIKLIASPVQFDHTPIQNNRAPEASEHTEQFLMEIGIEWDRIEKLKGLGAIA